MTKKGLFIAIEGTDGAGKATQAKILGSRLRSIGHHTALTGFPRYDTPTGKLVRCYTNDEFGKATELNPRAASKFYAYDRLAAASEICSWLDAGKTVISDRYTDSNKAHQGGKIANLNERLRFYGWIDDFEFTQNSIPKPDLHVILHVPAAVGLARATRRAAAKGITLDGHENIDHLSDTERTYLEIAALNRADHLVIRCVKDDKELDADAVGELVWSAVTGFLANR